NYVAGNDVLVTAEGRRGEGLDDDAATGQALARVVVRVAGQAQGQAGGNEGAQALSRGTFQVDLNVVVVKCPRAQRAGDRAAGQRAHRAVDVAHQGAHDERGSFVRSAHRIVEERPIKRAVESMGLLHALAPLIRVNTCQEGAEVEVVVVLARRVHRDARGVTDDLVQRARAQQGQVLADLLGYELEEVLDEFRLAGEALAQYGVLRGDADRTGVQVTDAHHHAARDHQRGGREAVLFGTEQRGHYHVASGFQLSVDLKHDSAAQSVGGQGLVRL